MSLWILMWNLPPLKSTSPKQSLGTFEAHRLWQLNLQSGHENVQTNQYSCSKWRYIVCRGGQYDDMCLTVKKILSFYHFILCFVVHFGRSSDDPWLRGSLQSAGSEKSDTEQKTAFHKIGRHPVFHISAVADNWRLLVMSKSERHYVADLANAELLAIVGKSIWSDILSIWLSVDSWARQRINILMCTSISRQVEKGRLPAQLVTKVSGKVTLVSKLGN